MQSEKRAIPTSADGGNVQGKFNRPAVRKKRYVKKKVVDAICSLNYSKICEAWDNVMDE